MITKIETIVIIKLKIIENFNNCFKSEVSIEDVRSNVIVLVRFATALMETLQRLNKDALQDFKLRVGIAVGN